MKIFLDFDDVVFGAKKFNIERIKIVKNFGITEEVFNQYFEEFKKNRKNGELITYSQDKHIESLENMLSGNGIDFKKLKKELSKFIKNAQKYVFEEFYNFTKKIGKENLFLLSYGDIEYQKEKIENSGVKEYFNEIIVTDGLKSEAIAEGFKNDEGEIIINEKVYFIDDRVAHLEDVKKEFPEIKTLLMASGHGRHKEEKNEFCDGMIKDFAEIEQLLEQDGELKR